MLRQIIHIDEDKCNGCGLCAEACHEGAIDIIDGKAKLVREHFCDGLGDCLPNCPTGAITFEEREAPAYDEAAVKASQMQAKQAQNRFQISEDNKMDVQQQIHHNHPAGGCPGSQMMTFHRSETPAAGSSAAPVMDGGSAAPAMAAGNAAPAAGLAAGSAAPAAGLAAVYAKPVSRLQQWPCQIKLVPVQAPFFDGAKLLIAADCTAYAYANMHEDFMKGKVTLIGCPKLDAIDYSEKLTSIIANNDIKSVTIVRMEVPCCGGLQHAAETALKNSGKFIPWQVVTISRDGRILD
ncbi:MAG: 4Fe-4S binding protein [Eubacterium sp.]|nr:4Fe-4S binding protein [Eubacterium sp.]